VREAVLSAAGRGTRPVRGDVAPNPSALRVLEYAAEESRGLGHNHIGTEHLILGITRLTEDDVKQTAVAAVLATLGYDLDALRRRTPSAALGTAGSGAPPPRDNVVVSRVEIARWASWMRWSRLACTPRAARRPRA
jgi:ATP-dependent Clp protease ATP-binding subunit ClpC